MELTLVRYVHLLSYVEPLCCILLHCYEVCVCDIDAERARAPNLSLVLGEGESLWNGLSFADGAKPGLHYCYPTKAR